MKIDLQKFNQLVEDKLISVQKHDTMDRLIWNYTHKCQYDKVWTEETMMARGLITDLGGNIIARPFRKFFNWQEKPDTIPADNPIIYEKMDGSLGIQYYDGDKVCIATRGSFNSDQAKWATAWMQKKGFTKSDFPDGYTFLYEIIYPQNRIVVNYGDRAELVMLAMIETETGVEAFAAAAVQAAHLGIATPKLILNHTLDSIASQTATLSGNEEGYVFHWPESNNLRIKMKGAEYVRLHRLITGFSTKSIWECLMHGQNLDDILKDIPDEFYDWVRLKEAELNRQYDEVDKFVTDTYGFVAHISGRKEQAQWIMKHAKEISAELFKILDGKQYDQIIWKKLKPKYELPFKQDIDA